MAEDINFDKVPLVLLLIIFPPVTAAFIFPYSPQLTVPIELRYIQDI